MLARKSHREWVVLASLSPWTLLANPAVRGKRGAPPSSKPSCGRSVIPSCGPTVADWSSSECGGCMLHLPLCSVRSREAARALRTALVARWSALPTVAAQPSFAESLPNFFCVTSKGRQQNKNHNCHIEMGQERVHCAATASWLCK